ncbi:restriction endonuclease subunit S [Limnospira fusiformis KN01]|uniref:restriction endonuclease subunit S n=1 Tax=Limnospira fusiformis TaxID=54297 RepID=UPI00165875BB|nr:restriction endonuclease subunit S [Limnospira fusiformis]ULB47903.1 restriction endonuclease subunit S [Limnospira fusiformis KN01]
MSVDGWNDEVKLGFLIEHQKGFAFKSCEYESSGHPVIRVSNFTDRSIDTSDCKFILPSKAKDYEAFILKQGDVVIATVGSWPSNPASVVGKTVCVPVKLDGALLNQNAVRLRSKGGIDQKFLFYLLKTQDFQDYIIGTAQGSANQASITLKAIFNFTFSLPPLDEQKAIAHILGTLDDKIELNQQMNRTLEGIARAIFKSWFIDFDPVRAKMDGRQPVGMDAETAALFPDEFEDSPLGQIPKGWKLDCIGNHVKIIKGRSYKSSELIPSDTALVTLKSIQRGGGYSQNGLKPYSGIYKSDQIIKPGELVVAYTDITQAADVIGKPAIVRRTSHFKTLVASLDLGIVRPVNEVLSIPFLYCLFMTDDFQSHVYGHTNGSTVLHLGKDGIPAYSFLIPNQSIISCFSYYAAPVFEKLEINEIQMYSLQSLRDTLLPKLLSGEIRVKDAEKIVEEVV